MDKLEIKQRNEELRKTARLPEGEHDITNVMFKNIHNGIVMTIVSHWVGDMGVVLWTSEAGDIYSTRDIKAHWDMLEEEPKGW